MDWTRQAASLRQIIVCLRLDRLKCWPPQPIFFTLLLDVAVFDLLHEGFALEEVALKIGSELAGDDEKLVVDHLGDGDGAAGGN